MAGLGSRLWAFLIGEDEALNALGGGSPKQTISGTVGRAVLAGKWWGKPLAAVIDAIFGDGHCLREAEKETA